MATFSRANGRALPAATAREYVISTQRKPGSEVSQKFIRSRAATSRSPSKARNCAISATVAPLSGGGGSLNWLPEVSTQVFHVPARGSTCCAQPIFEPSVTRTNPMSTSSRRRQPVLQIILVFMFYPPSFLFFVSVESVCRPNRPFVPTGIPFEG